MGFFDKILVQEKGSGNLINVTNLEPKKYESFIDAMGKLRTAYFKALKQRKNPLAKDKESVGGTRILKVADMFNGDWGRCTEAIVSIEQNGNLVFLKEKELLDLAATIGATYKGL